jgi:DNA adenine methylase
LNGDIPHFFRVLRDRGDELQEWLRNVPYSREVYANWADEYYSGKRKDDDIERAGRFYYLRYASFGGKIENKSGFATGKYPGGPTTGQYHKSLAALTDFQSRLKEVIIENKSAFDLIDSYDRVGSLFYADPPYEGTEGRYNSQGFDHQKLAEKAKKIDGKFAISYDSIPPHYSDDFTVVSKHSSFGIDSDGSHKDATEYLIMNYDPNDTPMFREQEQQGLEAYE